MKVRWFSMVLAGVLLAVGNPADAQGWTLPTRAMPMMPTMANLPGGWQGSAGAWAGAAARLAGVSAGAIRGAGEAASGSERTAFVRFTSEARPVATWTDRNGDGRSDMVELFRGGILAVQVVDADYDGQADAVRHFDSSGKPLRTEEV